MEKICPACGKQYEALGMHWRYNRSHEPEFSQEQKEIITGLLMGDGFIDAHGDRTPRLKTEMETRAYLEYLNTKFPVYSLGINVFRTAEESAKQARKRGFSENAQAKNYSTTYAWKTHSSTQFEPFQDWYKTGKKVWPDDIEMTPTVLTHLYVGDGSIEHCDDSNRNPRITITMSNEYGNKEKIMQMFSTAGIPEPTWVVCERAYGYEVSAQWSVENTQALLEYMNEPLPGFEYKWPEEYR